ncbi:unnamed protein product [Owenia fusiformis]|uniref:Uncharacterized protein n=1 Tax=Owenia fusiformis TaxID=6347 RepID=A0A8J1Y6M5_OWEFU|nr:unnamed protein product [Owenia fusiformis]
MYRMFVFYMLLMVLQGGIHVLGSVEDEFPIEENQFNEQANIEPVTKAESNEEVPISEEAHNSNEKTSLDINVASSSIGENNKDSDVKEAEDNGDKDTVEEDGHTEESKEFYPETSLFNIGDMITNVIGEIEDVKESQEQLKENMRILTGQGINNVTMNDTIVNATTVDKRKYVCTPKNLTKNDTELETTPIVKIVNSTELLEILTERNGSAGNCAVVLFFAPWCPFCAKAAPEFNAVARAFPQLDVLAIDSMHFSSLNARFGTIAVPNILLFHNTKAVAKFNHTSRTLDKFVNFLVNSTGFEPDKSVNVTAEDYIGPLLSIPTEEKDYLLWVAWLFLIAFTSWVTVRSHIGQRLRQNVMLAWAEHQHMD